MFARWRPTGPGRKEVIQAGRADSRTLLERVMAAADRLMVV
jgi:hypothetical protein